MYNHCNICNILIYFCNIRVKHLYISETFETYACNMRFQCNISVLLGEEKLIRYGVHRWRGACRSCGEGCGRLAVASCVQVRSALATASWAGGARDVCGQAPPGCGELHADELRPGCSELGNLRQAEMSATGMR
jgi:hypothetical protein